jgi:hypothetical protein
MAFSVSINGTKAIENEEKICANISGIEKKRHESSSSSGNENGEKS